MQYFRGLFELNTLVAEPGELLIDVATRTCAGLRSDDRGRQAFLELLAEHVTQVDSTISGGFADAGDSGDVLPSELAVRRRDGAIDQAPYGLFEFTPIVQGNSHG